MNMKVTKAQYLEHLFGGIWKYDGRASWWCDDGKRWVGRFSSCTCDDWCRHSPRYFMYSDDIKQSPIEINEWYEPFAFLV